MKRPNVARLHIPDDGNPVPATSTIDACHSTQPPEEHAKTGDAAFSISQASRGDASENSGECRKIGGDSFTKPVDPPARRSASKHRRASSVSRPAWLSEEQICSALAAPPVPPAFGAPSPRNAASGAAASASRRSSWAVAAGAHGIMAEGFGWGTIKGDECDSGISRSVVTTSMTSDPSTANGSTSSGNRLKLSFSSGDYVTDKDDVNGADSARLPWLPPVISSRSSSGESYPCLATPRSNRARRRSFTNTSSGNRERNRRPEFESRLSLSEASETVSITGVAAGGTDAAAAAAAAAATSAAAAAAAPAPASAASSAATDGGAAGAAAAATTVAAFPHSQSAPAGAPSPSPRGAHSCAGSGGSERNARTASRTACAPSAAPSAGAPSAAHSVDAPAVSPPSSPAGGNPSSGFGGGGAMTPRQRAARSMFPRAMSASSVHVSGESAGGGISGANRRRGGGRVVGRVGSSPLQPSPLQAFALQPSLLQAAASLSGVDAPAQENNTETIFFSQTGTAARAGPGLGRRGVTVAAAQKLKPLPELRQLSGRVALRQFSGLSGAPSYSSYRERRCGEEEEEAEGGENEEQAELFGGKKMAPRQHQPRQLQRGSTAPCDEIDGSVFEMVDPEESSGPEPPAVEGQCA
ncbi:unnamed protein product [Closterium sp. NIES-53]